MKIVIPVLCTCALWTYLGNMEPQLSEYVITRSQDLSLGSWAVAREKPPCPSPGAKEDVLRTRLSMFYKETKQITLPNTMLCSAGLKTSAFTGTVNAKKKIMT